ncbi:hypothetical protein OG331_25310 [Streptomyces sp. NBC_01017]|uniref:hypothetical protein n=1 Tax=Streptomyces sp. NBC_01017 TaxID=2903721 RepID=UPI00386E66ED|nr:hypothetical protein OG331_25310 [Streptomyces sp. NBC_01017]
MRQITATVEAFVLGETRTSSSAEDSALDLLPLPRVTSLSGLQARGAACVWCQIGLTIETAVDLGERPPGPGGVTLFPRGCRDCVRAAALRTYGVHADTCEQCVDNPTLCDTRRALRRLALEARG